MKEAKLAFSVLSGGTVSFDLEVCERCVTKACVEACNAPNLACVLEERNGLPALKVTPEQAARGACIECLACELSCATDGIGGISFSLPMPELDSLVDEMHRHGVRPGYEGP